ncbi:serine protein kinase PrkA [candidate division CSSED10-310 bacterium]|uniref:Serine protein kinase PrkA n=1 Tax=candidate division CSSED10-310 bacterium TaxID=2855610 RepID=A0ABV6Z305_UNCC1
MEKINIALDNLDRNLSEHGAPQAIPFEEFIALLVNKPHLVFRNVFQILHDMVKSYVGEGMQEYPDDPESIGFVDYDTSQLFVQGTDHPFFADRLFANRLINHIAAMRRGAQQNKIYIFEGPPGSGKSTFLNNLLLKLEEFANTELGAQYETVWKLNRKMLGAFSEHETIPLIENLFKFLEKGDDPSRTSIEKKQKVLPKVVEDILEVPCPSHDNPIIMIPKAYRRAFFDDLFENDEFKWKLFTQKEYEWVFKFNPCTICSSIYQALLSKLHSPLKVFKMLHARRYTFNRRVGEGISVYNPGDKHLAKTFMTNPMLQEQLDYLLQNSDLVKYIYSRYAQTNNGVYALMDIKSNNTERLMRLHNIISDGVHKVDIIEENVNSLFIALMNPEDISNVSGIQSFSDRIEYIKITYIMDLNTEVKIYRNIFGKHIDANFLPRVLQNFARVIISSRLNTESEALREWIGEPQKYSQYCDENLHLLKMELYRGRIPRWLSEEDRKQLTAKRRRKIVAESEKEGDHGFSGRDSIKIFNDFYSTFAKADNLITMANLYDFFTKMRQKLAENIPEGFLESLLRLYNYSVLQEVKESLYYYNEERISRDIQNYLFAVNFELGSVEKCTFTGEKLEITADFLISIENRILGGQIDDKTRAFFREDTQKAYTSKTLTQELMVEKKDITETELYQSLQGRYVYNLKEKVLDPFLENENFRRAIKDFDTDDFKTYDKKIREDVTFLIENLTKKHEYTPLGAKEVCIFVIDNDLAREFAKS